MPKNEVAAFLVMESAMEPMKPRDIRVIKDNGLFYLKFTSILQEFNALNRNRRIYKSVPMMESLNQPHIKELISKKSWKGEAGHPCTDDVKRILTIDPDMTSHKINNFELRGNLLYGEVETLDDGARGTRLTKNILQGMEPAFSLRALAQLVKQRDGTSLMQTKCHVVCYDRVILPSHDKAYRDETTPIEKIYKNVDDNTIVTESAGRIVPVQESQIVDYIKMESHNVKVISNVCEVALESMTLSSDKKSVIVREGTNTFIIPIEERIKRDVRSYLSNL